MCVVWLKKRLCSCLFCVFDEHSAFPTPDAMAFCSPHAVMRAANLDISRHERWERVGLDFDFHHVLGNEGHGNVTRRDSGKFVVPFFFPFQVVAVDVLAPRVSHVLAFTLCFLNILFFCLFRHSRQPSPPVDVVLAGSLILLPCRRHHHHRENFVFSMPIRVPNRPASPQRRSRRLRRCQSERGRHQGFPLWATLSRCACSCFVLL